MNETTKFLISFLIFWPFVTLMIMASLYWFARWRWPAHPERLCKNCKHHQPGESHYSYCTHPKLIKRDPVNGKLVSFADLNRKFDVFDVWPMYCGQTARYYEPKSEMEQE